MREYELNVDAWVEEPAGVSITNQDGEQIYILREQLHAVVQALLECKQTLDLAVAIP